jgi:type IV pilus assembly protein PilQ
MTYRKFGFFLISVFLTYGILGAGVQSGAQKSGKITDIAVQEVDSTTEISIESSAPFSYTVYRPADPYRFIVEMQDIAQGEFTGNMMIDRAGVMEIIPSAAEGAQAGVKLEIILSVPADIKPVQKYNTLLLSFYNPESGKRIASAGMGEGAELSKRDAKNIEDIDLIRSDGKVALVIRGDGNLHPSTFQPADTRLIVDIPDVAAKVESLRMYDPPVMGIRVGQQPDKTRIVIDLAPSTQYDLTSGEQEIKLTFTALEKPETKVAKVKRADLQRESAGTVLPEAAYFKSKKYLGEIISLDIQDAPLSKIFGIIAEISGYNIILSPQVQDQRVFIKLDNVPWDQALDVILRNYGLSKSVEGTIVRIAPTSVIAQEEELIARAKEAKMKSGDLETRMYPVDFADLGTLQDLIEDMREEAGTGGADRGSVSIDPRTNTLIITDVAQMHDEYEKVIRDLDTPTRQVSIEAKIVEVSRNFTQELGIQWGLLAQPTPQTQIGGFQGETGFFNDTPFLVNLPAAAGAGAGGSVAFGYIAANSLRALDIQLSAMESSGNGKIISNPKIITLDNEEASISQGQQIPYQSVSAEGTQTQFVSASLELDVTPHITPTGTIVMDISTKKNEADFANSVQGVPSINTNEAESRVLVNNGDTLVMGGILKSDFSNSQAYVPMLGRIPILGRLFRTERDTDNTSELLIFVTPRVIK